MSAPKPRAEDRPHPIRFQEFARLAFSAGARVEDCGAGRWRVSGRLRVDYWPRFPAGPLLHVVGTRGPTRCCSPERAIAAAFELPPLVRKRVRRNRLSTSHGERLKIEAWLRQGRRCYWCKRACASDETTIEHLIPLARGGTHKPENIAAACEPCNCSRGSEMPELRSLRETLVHPTSSPPTKIEVRRRRRAQ